MDMVTPSQPRRAGWNEVRAYTAEELKAAVLGKLKFTVGKDPVAASQRDWFLAGRRGDARHHGRALDRVDQPHLRGRAQARLLSVARVPDRPPAVRRADQSRHRRADARRRWRSLGVDLDALRAHRARRGARQRRPRPPRRLLHGEHGDARRSPPTATASATTTACSARSSRTAGSRNRRRTGCATATPGSSSGPRSPTPSASAARSRRSTSDGDTPRHVWHPGRDGRGGRPTTRRGRLARPARQHAAAVVGARARSAAARRLQRRRLHRRARRPRARRGDLQGALSQRRDAGRPGTAAAAGIFLRLRLAAGPRAPPRASSIEDIRTLGRQGRRSSSTTPIRRSRSPS